MLALRLARNLRTQTLRTAIRQADADASVAPAELTRSRGRDAATASTSSPSVPCYASRGFATRALGSSDRIHMRGLVFYAYHGVYPEEEKLGQRFDVDLTLCVNLREAGLSDDLEHTVNYGAVYMLVKGIVEGRRRQLIEAVAEDIARAVLTHSARVTDVTVAVKKPHVAVPGIVDFLGVEVSRSRGDER